MLVATLLDKYVDIMPLFFFFSATPMPPRYGNIRLLATAARYFSDYDARCFAYGAMLIIDAATFILRHAY